MSAFVPGPWTYNPFLPSVMADGKMIAWVSRSRCGDAAHPTAHLIAAAPELLEALQRVLMWEPRSTEAACAQDYDFARAAIRKALVTEGERDR